MDTKTFDYKMNSIKATYKSEKNKLYKEFALANNPHGIGDIIQDHIGFIQIEKIIIGVDFGSKYSSCIYYGLNLKKSNKKPFKDKSKRSVSQKNIIE